MKRVCIVIAITAFASGCQTTLSGADFAKGWRIYGPNESHSVQVVSDVVRGGTTAFRFETRSGEKQWEESSIKSHNELIETDFHAIMGNEYWYGFSMYIPKNSPINKSRWLILGQWHAKPDVGEVWRSPPLSQQYNHGLFEVAICHSSEKIQKNNLHINFKKYLNIIKNYL